MSKHKPVYILTRMEDGSWKTDGEEYTERAAQKLIQQARILGGIQSRTFPVDEYQKLHPELFEESQP